MTEIPFFADLAAAQSDTLRHLDILGNERGEVRFKLVSGRTERMFFNRRTTAAFYAARQSAHPSVAAAYATVHELDPRIGRLPNINSQPSPGKSTKNGMVVCYRNLILDGDPNKPEGFKGPASHAEHEAVMRLIERARELIRRMEWADPWLMNSGNGGYCGLRLPDLPNTPESRALVERVLRAFAAHLDGPDGHIDTSVSEPARVFRLAGTWNRKGTATEDRPYRQTHLLCVPDVLQPVTVEQLEKFASEVPAMRPKRRKASKSQEPNADDGEADRLANSLKEYLAHCDYENLEVSREHDKVKLQFPDHYCPIKGATHENATAAVMVYRDDPKPAFRCFAEKCAGKTFKDLEAKFGVRFHTFLGEKLWTDFSGICRAAKR